MKKSKKMQNREQEKIKKLDGVERDILIKRLASAQIKNEDLKRELESKEKRILEEERKRTELTQENRKYKRLMEFAKFDKQKIIVEHFINNCGQCSNTEKDGDDIYSIDIYECMHCNNYKLKIESMDVINFVIDGDGLDALKANGEILYIKKIYRVTDVKTGNVYCEEKQ